jgi:hypothetical protein
MFRLRGLVLKLKPSLKLFGYSLFSMTEKACFKHKAALRDGAGWPDKAAKDGENMGIFIAVPRYFAIRSKTHQASLSPRSPCAAPP